MADVSHLERMGTELKCPICLGILNSAVSLTCNHVFCNLCINKSMKLGPNCPVCKVPYQRREIRHAPHMDNLVTIYKSMESAIGTDILSTQIPKRSKLFAKESKIDGNKISEREMDVSSGCLKYERKETGKMPKTIPRSKCVHDHDVMKPSFPNKKRIQVPQNPLSESPLAAKKYESTKSFNEEGSQKKPWLRKTAELALLPFFWLKENTNADDLSHQTDDDEFSMNASPVTFSDIEDSHDELGGLNAESDPDECFDNGLFEWTQRACSLSPLGTQVEDTYLEPSLNVNAGGLKLNIGSVSDESMPGERKCKKRSQRICKNSKEKKSKKHKSQVEEIIDLDIVLDSIEDEKIDKNVSENHSKSTKRHREITCSSTSTAQLKAKKIRRKDDNSSHVHISSVDTCDDRAKLNNFGGRNIPTDKSRACFRDISNVDHMVIDRNHEKHVKNMTLAKENEHGGCFSRKYERGARPFPVLQKCTTVQKQIQCAFCNSSLNSEISGEMIHYVNGAPVDLGENEGKKMTSSHKCCTEWAPNVYFDGENAVNLASELARSRHIKCNFCGEKGAALGCFERSCRKSFHFPCAKKIPECRWDSDNFVMLCPLHSSHSLPSENPQSQQKQSHRFSRKRSSSRSGLERDGTMASGWSSGSTRRLVLSCSAVTPTEKEMVMEFAKISGCLVLKRWDPKITHVIASTNEKGECRRTLKFMMGILHGKWILSLNWIAACTKALKHVEEEPFEITSDVYGIVNGPITGRLRLLHKEEGLFEGKSFYLYGEYKNDSYKGNVEDVIRAGGGILLCRKPVVYDGMENNTFVVYDSSSIGEQVSKAVAFAESSGAIAVTNTWIFHSISASSLQPIPLLSFFFF